MEPNLEAFETKLVTSRGVQKKAFLIMSPEYAHKKLLASGIGNTFEITKAFRNFEEVSSSHNPEFTILEWYRTNTNYFDVMEDFQNMFIEIIKNIKTADLDITKWEYQKEFYNLTTPWTKISVNEAFEDICGITTDDLLDEQKLLQIGSKKGYKIEKDTNWEQIFYQIFLNEIEPELKKMKKPVFIFDYPVSQASLSKKKDSDPRFAERFEIYLAGLELGNCFSELIDADEQKQRLIADFNERKRLGKNPYPVDNELIRALKSGLPEVSGIAVGVDRLIMLASNTNSIEETLFFSAAELFDLK